MGRDTKDHIDFRLRARCDKCGHEFYVVKADIGLYGKSIIIEIDHDDLIHKCEIDTYTGDSPY